MQAPASLHPSEQTLWAFGNGQLDAASAESVSTHLDGCQECVLKVAGISPDGFLDAFRRARSTQHPQRCRTEMDRDQSPAATRSYLPSTEPSTSPVSEEIPAELASHPDYKILRELGRGGMGVVYLAHNRLMGRDEVLKVMGRHIITRPGVMDRFLREIRAVAQLRHPNIVAAYTAFRSGESLVFAMEYVEGLDLARMVRARGPMPIRQACSYVHQSALGLQHAHERGMVHRDIKPGNLMLSHNGNRALIKVLDFGLAKAGRENEVVSLGLGDAQPMGRVEALTLAGQMLGTPDFIAPEQIDDAQKADIRADIYSLGCSLYYLLSGRPPFRAATLYDILQAHHSMDAQMLNFVRPEVPSELAALVAKMMAKEPKRRFQTPDEVAKAVSPFFKRRAQTGVAPGFGVSPVDAPATSLSTAGPTQVATDSAPAPAPAATTVAARDQNRPEEMWRSLINFTETEEIQPAAAVATEPVRTHPRRFWPALAGLVGFVAILLVAGITYRIATDEGVLVIETDDPSIEVVVKQGSKRVTIIDPQTKNRIELHSGQYELELAGDKPGLKLSTEQFTLKRGDKTVVTVRREAPVQAPKAQPASDLLAGPGTEQLGEIARFQSPHDLVGAAFLLPDGRHVIYTTGGDNQNDRWLPGTDPALWLGDLADPKNPRKYTGHGPGGISLALARDGRLALTGSADKTLRLWDIETGKSRRILRQETGIGAVAFSPDERRAAYVTGDTIRLCDLKTGDELMTLRGHSGRIGSFAFCRDGNRLVSGGTDDHTIRVWDLKTGKELRQMKHGHGVVSVAVFPDDRRVLTGSWDRTIGIWDLATGRQLRRISGIIPDQYGATVAISPDGRRALFGTLRDNAVRLWDVESGEELERFEGHTGGVGAVAFAPDGRRAVSGSFDKTVRVWALPPGRPPGVEPPLMEVAHFLGHDGSIHAVVAVSPDGRRLLSGSNDKTLILWDRETAQPIRRLSGHTEGVSAVAIAPDGRRALSGGGDRIVRLWDLEAGETIRELHGHTEPVFSVAFSPDGRLGYSTSGGFYRGSGWQDGKDTAIRVWDLETGQEVRRLEGHQGLVWSVAVSPDGRRVLSGGNDGAAILWDAKTGAEIRRFREHNTRVGCAAFLPDGRRAVSVGNDRTIRLWDVETGQEIRRFHGHTHDITWVAVSPDGRRLLSSSYGGRELRLWDLETGKPVHRINWGNKEPARGSFTPDGRHAVWAGMDGVIRMYRLTVPVQANRQIPPG